MTFHCTKSFFKGEEKCGFLRDLNLLLYIFRGLFERHKIVFSFMLCAEILRERDVISNNEWNYFLRGSASLERVKLLCNNRFCH